jgi:hypothetical protein
VSLLIVLVAVLIMSGGQNQAGSPAPITANTNIPIKTSTLSVPAVLTEKTIVLATYRAKPTRTPFPTPEPVPTGTREGDRVKFSAQKLGIDAENAWSGMLDGGDVSVYAGTNGYPDQGALAILIFGSNGFDGYFLTPTRHGAVRVIGEQHNRLILQAKDGTLFYFDLPARRFVATLSEIALTATPAAKYPPPATARPYPYPNPPPYPYPYPYP